MAEELVRHWTEPIDQKLLVDGAEFDFTGMTIELVLRGNDGSEVNTTGKVAWIDATAGTARYSPADNDFVPNHSPYHARWKVTSIGGKVVFFPNGKADVWTIRD